MNSLPDIEDLLAGLLRRDHGKVSQAITLIESDHPGHWDSANDLLLKVQTSKKQSLRLGVSGPPGVGKSTFIETLGVLWTKANKSIAVLAVDPSSQLSGGSILGDKTRMEKLAREPKAFVRPSPSRGHLGGVTESLPGALAICEAAGFDIIVVETVGVGQSEVAIAGMVDHFALLVQPGSGDDLQGIKKGVLEFVDSVIINKVDQDSGAANWTKSHLQSALKIMRGHDVPLFLASALKGQGVESIFNFVGTLEVDEKRRQQMNGTWFRSLLLSYFVHRLEGDTHWQQTLEAIEQRVQTEDLLPMQGVQDFFTKILPS